MTCSKCKKTFYCLQNCQYEEWKDHKVLCDAFCQLENEKGAGVERSGQFSSEHTPEEKPRLLKLVGGKNVVDVILGGKAC